MPRRASHLGRYAGAAVGVQQASPTAAASASKLFAGQACSALSICSCRRRWCSPLRPSPPLQKPQVMSQSPALRQDGQKSEAVSMTVVITSLPSSLRASPHVSGTSVVETPSIPLGTAKVQWAQLLEDLAGRGGGAGVAQLVEDAGAPVAGTVGRVERVERVAEAGADVEEGEERGAAPAAPAARRGTPRRAPAPWRRARSPCRSAFGTSRSPAGSSCAIRWRSSRC